MKLVSGILIPDASVQELTINQSVSLQPGSTMVVVITNKSALTVRLPIAAESADCFVGVLVKGVEPAGTITVNIVDAGDTDMTAFTLTAVNHYTCLYCDGLFWYPIVVYNS